MKKILFSTFIMLILALNATAQDPMGIIFDGLDWSENDYGGSSRTMGMGNAVTAVGGDLGSFQFNPAGSAVASYSQVGVTMGGSVSMTTTSNIQDVNRNSYDRTKGKFIFPNGGFSLRFDTGNSSGLKRFTFAFTANAVNIYNFESYASVKNSPSSYAGYIGNLATENNYAPGDLKNYNVDYAISTLYNSGIIAHVPDYVGSNYYVGTTENIKTDKPKYYKDLGGSIDQQHKSNISGSKMDYLINFGFDISDIVYFGASLGITSINYNVQDLIAEQNNDVINAMEGISIPDKYFQSGFRQFTYNYSYKSSGTGLYGKFGVIVTPIAGLRVGAAIQTPTRIRMSETVMHSSNHEVKNEGSSTSSFYTSNSPRSNWVYDLSTPMRFNLGVAYTFSNIAIVSIDYERVNYKSMRFHPYYMEDDIYFDRVNNIIQGFEGTQYLQGSNMVRVGAEVKPIPELAIRVGYNFTSNGLVEVKENTNAFTLGLGYDSPWAFFCDIAAKMTYQPSYSVKPYENYSDAVTGKVFVAPELTSTRRLLNIVGTIGWRF